jgi:hypothetical protein
MRVMHLSSNEAPSANFGFARMRILAKIPL